MGLERLNFDRMREKPLNTRLGNRTEEEPDYMKKKPSTVTTLPAPPNDFINRELRIVLTKTGEVVRHVDVTGKSDHLVQKAMSGMLRNMADEYHAEDSVDDT